MEISVVVPAFNAAAFVEQTIRSVLAQSIADWELVVVDDGSIDDTAGASQRVAGRDARFRLVQQENRGLSAARNRGLAETNPHSAAVIFLDADDVWAEDALSALSAALATDANAVAATGLSAYIDEQGQPFQPGELEVWGRRRLGVAGPRLVNWPASAPTELAVLAHRNTIATPGQALIRRTALESAGGFDPTTSPCEDWDLWLRLALHGHLAFVDQVVLQKRKHAGGLSQHAELMYRQQVAVRRKLLSTAMTPEQRRIVLRANWHWGQYVTALKLREARSRLARGELGAAVGWACKAAAGSALPLLRRPAA